MWRRGTALHCCPARPIAPGRQRPPPPSHLTIMTTAVRRLQQQQQQQQPLHTYYMASAQQQQQVLLHHHRFHHHNIQSPQYHPLAGGSVATKISIGNSRNYGYPTFIILKRGFVSSPIPPSPAAAAAATEQGKEEDDKNQDEGQQATEEKNDDNEATPPPTPSEGEVAAAVDPNAPLFSCPAPRFFRLLAGASMTQVAFWTSYSFLPPEINSGHMGLWGILGSGAFIFICRHFAQHYVWEVDLISPVAFRIKSHTFWGNKTEPGRIVQVGTTECQETSRYIAFKVKGDSFWYLLDVREGKFKNEEAKATLSRMFHGLSMPAGLVRSEGGEEGGEGSSSGRGKRGRERGGRKPRWKK